MQHLSLEAIRFVESGIGRFALAHPDKVRIPEKLFLLGMARSYNQEKIVQEFERYLRFETVTEPLPDGEQARQDLQWMAKYDHYLRIQEPDLESLMVPTNHRQTHMVQILQEPKAEMIQVLAPLLPEFPVEMLEMVIARIPCTTEDGFVNLYYRDDCQEGCAPYWACKDCSEDNYHMYQRIKWD